MVIKAGRYTSSSLLHKVSMLSQHLSKVPYQGSNSAQTHTPGVPDVRGTTCKYTHPASHHNDTIHICILLSIQSFVHSATYSKVSKYSAAHKSYYLSFLPSFLSSFLSAFLPSFPSLLPPSLPSSLLPSYLPSSHPSL